MKCCFIQETDIQQKDSQKKDSQDQQILLTGENFHHVIRVLRLKIGESLEFKSSSYAYRGILVRKQKETAWFQIQSKRELKKPKLSIHLCQSLIEDRNSFEWILQKATELGVTSIIPYIAERSKGHWNRSAHDSLLKRWEKIIQRASQQSGRDFLTHLQEPVSSLENLEKLISFSSNSFFSSSSPSNASTSPSQLKIIALESIQKPSLRTLLTLHSKTISKTVPKTMSFFLLVGPEGGFSDRELEKAKKLSFLPCSLSPLTLKSETASLCMLANLSFFYL